MCIRIGFLPATNKEYNIINLLIQFIMYKKILFKTMLLLCALMVGSGSVWATDVTVSMTSFSDISGYVNGDTNISYEAAKGNAATAPAVNSNEIRVYQNGGTFTVTANNNVKIKSVTLGSSMGTTVTYSIDGGTASSDQSISAGGNITVNNLECSSVLFTCTGTSKTTRLYVNYLSVTYATSGDTPAPTTYTVTYDANGGTGEMTDTNSPYNAGATVTVLDNTFTRDNYTFVNWNTASDGSGTDYDGGDTFTINDNTTLYAQWDQNGGGSGNGKATLTSSNLELTGSYTTNTSKTIDGITYVYTDLMKNNSNIQAKASSGTIKNTTAYPGDITSVAITHSGTARATTINGSADGTNWTQVATGDGSITADFSGKGYKYFQITRGSNAAYWEKIEITYSNSSTPSTPSINASDVNIDYNATGGNIAFTINNGVDGGAISASTTDSWVTLGNETTSPISFTCSANTESTARTATVTLTYTYNTNETITKNVTITQAAAPVVYSTIPALFAAATSTETPVNVTFNNWVVSGVSTNGKNVFVTDNSGNGFVLYYNSDMSSTYSAGDILSGTAVSGSLKQYNGFAELLDVDANDLTITSGGTVTAANITMANLAGVNTGALVSYENLTCSEDNNKYYLSDGTTTLQVYNSLYAFDALEDGKTYNITGVYQQYNSTKEILPRSAADIVEVVITTPSISVATNTINAAYAGASGTIDVTYNNIATVVADVYFCESDGTTPATYNWIDAEINNTTNNVDYVIDANTGAARTAYMKVYAIGDNSEDVYSELITISQAQFAVSVAQAVFKKVTSGSEIAAGNQYLIVYEGTTSNKVFTGVSSDVGQQEEIVIDNGIITDAGNGAIVVLEDAGIRSTGELDVQQWYIKHGTMYLSAPSSNKLNEVSTTSDNAKWENLPDEIYNYTTSRYLQYNASQPRFCCYQSSSNMKDVSLYRMVEQITPAKAMVSYCSVNDLDFTGMDLHAYVVSNVANGKAQIKEEAGIPANQGMILKGTASTTYDVPVVATAPTLTNTNMLIGTTAMTNVEAETGYTFLALSNGEFVVMNPGQVKPNKAYLKVNSSILGDSSKLALSFDDNDATAINDINANKQDGVYYNLNGMRVNAPQKGIYILNGKKIVVK